MQRTVTSDEATRVTDAVATVLRNEASVSTVLQFSATTIRLTKGCRLGDATQADIPAEYPTVQTTLTDEKDSWLK